MYDLEFLFKTLIPTMSQRTPANVRFSHQIFDALCLKKLML